MPFLRDTPKPSSIITIIENDKTYPENIDGTLKKYKGDIELFAKLVSDSESTEVLFRTIREAKVVDGVKVDKDRRMTFLKLFRRCACTVCDTEATKKIRALATNDLIELFGKFFKDISTLKSDFEKLSADRVATLLALIGEYDSRGQQGYKLTGMFFDWFEKSFPDWEILGPRGAGKDIELSSVLEDFKDPCPCDFIILNPKKEIRAVGFARYDSTRGGAQSDDRTGGNSDKVTKLKRYHQKTGKQVNIIFLSDGPGLLHNDTWKEACHLEESWDDNVRVTTLKTAPQRITKEWLHA